MGQPTPPAPPSSRPENARLLAQAEAMAGDGHIRREAEPWRDSPPEQRLAATWALCESVPWFRALWSEETLIRAAAREPLPADALAILEGMRAAASHRR